MGKDGKEIEEVILNNFDNKFNHPIAPLVDLKDIRMFSKVNIFACLRCGFSSMLIILNMLVLGTYFNFFIFNQILNPPSGI